MTTPFTTFGSWLKQRRRMLGMSQVELAQRVPCAEITIRKLEAGTIRPGKELAERLAECLELTLAEREPFVLVGRGLATPVPTPLVSTPPHQRTNLLEPPTALIGRSAELTAIRERLLHQQVRLLTLIGTPGIGKTRLSLEVALQLRDDFRDGVYLVQLAPVQSADMVTAAIARTLGLQVLGDTPLIESLKLFLQLRHLLLVLDNFEHLLGAAAMVGELLTVAPLLKVIVTSRESLHLQAEHTFAVSPLATPPLKSHPQAYQSLLHYPAVQLFVERAQAVNPDFALNAANGQAVAELCVRLEGLPLAIELAARRSNLYGPRALLARLSKRLNLLTGKVRDLPARQQTLRAAIDWSYALLTPLEQRVLARAGVFWGSFTLEAAASVCGGAGRDNDAVWDALGSLVDKSLLKQNEGEDGEPRFMMLEMIREYAQDKLTEQGRLEQVQQCHYDTFLALALAGEAGLKGRAQEAWLARLYEALPNLRGVLSWTVGNNTRTEAGLHLAATLGLFWEYGGLQAEGHEWITTLLTQGGVVVPAIHAKALAIGGFMLGWMGAYTAAKPWLESSVAISRAAGAQQELALALFTLRFIYEETDPPLALEIMTECVALYRTLGDRWGLGRALGAYALVVGLDPNATAEALAQAREGCQEAEYLFNEIGDRWTQAWVMVGKATVAEAEHNIPQSYYYWRLASDCWQESRNLWGVLIALNMASWYAIALDDLPRAMQHLEELYGLTRNMVGERRCHVIGNLAECCATIGDLVRALALYREALAFAYQYKMPFELGFTLRDIAVIAMEVAESEALSAPVLQALIGTTPSPTAAQELGIYATTLLGARLPLFDAVDADRMGLAWSRDHWFFHAAWAQNLIGVEAYFRAIKGGCLMTIEQSVAYALNEPLSRVRNV